MNLYEIDARIKSVMDMVDDDGEISTEIVDELMALNQDFIMVADNVAALIKNIEAESDAIKNEEKNLSERRKSKDKKVDGLKKYLASAMIVNGQKKIETPRVKLSTLITPSVSIIDLSLIPSEYHRIKTVDEPDKDLIKRALKSGETVDGAELIFNASVTIK